VKSYNPICEPSDDEDCKFDRSPAVDQGSNLEEEALAARSCSGVFDEDQNFSFPRGRSLSEDEDELTESKIKAFLYEKVWIFSLRLQLLCLSNSPLHCRFIKETCLLNLLCLISMP